MSIAKLVSFLGIVAMVSALAYAFAVGDFRAEGSDLLSMPWGIVSLVDLYVGFTLFAGWILYREASLLKAMLWVILLMIFGFLIGSIYALLALYASQGNWTQFWQGSRYADS